MKKYCFEDFKTGDHLPVGQHTLTAEEIIDFAQQFDPAPYHLDEEAGKASFLGGLAASGWHLCALSMKMICDTYLLNSTSQGSPGIGQCRWLKPVLAGDTVHVGITVLETRLSSSKPGLGFVGFQLDMHNQRNERVMTFTNTGMFLTREAA